MDSDSVEDILNDSLALLDAADPDSDDHGTLIYGPVVVTVAPKEGKANTLLADHIFSPALLLAERIERGLIPVGGRTVVELGAGAALPSLVAAALPVPPALVVVTDYPDAGILGNLACNVMRNHGSIARGCTVRCVPYEWATDPQHVLALAPAGFDVVVLSDLLHFDRAHGQLLDSVAALLGRRQDARVVVAAGVYTRAELCQAFLREGEGRGIVWVERGDRAGDDEGREADAVWRGRMEVRGLDAEQLGVRKGIRRWSVGRWADAHACR